MLPPTGTSPSPTSPPADPDGPDPKLSEKLTVMAVEDRKEDQGREGIMRALKQQYLEGKPFDEIIEESGISRSTLFRWRKQQKWDEEKNRKSNLDQKLVETLAFYEDPTNTEQAIAERNLQLLLRIQGLNLAKLFHRAVAGEAPDMLAIAMSDSLNKYSSTLEKLIKSDQSIKSGGVETKQVIHVHQLDMDDALALALELKKNGQQITVQEAMALLQAQQSTKKVKADEHAD